MFESAREWPRSVDPSGSGQPVPVLERRDFLAALVGTAGVLAVPRLAWAAATSDGPFQAAMSESGLVYVSPLVTNGKESRCHAEVWFVAEGGDLLVVTNQERWRAVAIGKGFDRARLWVAEHGVWTRANEAWKKSPSADAKARIERAPEQHARALKLFGAKYTESWSKWGPRFEEGLATGDRVLIRYSPQAI